MCPRDAPISALQRCVGLGQDTRGGRRRCGRVQKHGPVKGNCDGVGHTVSGDIDHQRRKIQRNVGGRASGGQRDSDDRACSNCRLRNTRNGVGLVEHNNCVGHGCLAWHLRCPDKKLCQGVSSWAARRIASKNPERHGVGSRGRGVQRRDHTRVKRGCQSERTIIEADTSYRGGGLRRSAALSA